MTIDERYEWFRSSPSDINEHLSTLSALASACDHVTEFGVRKGVSTVALIHGRPKRVISYDLRIPPEIPALVREAAAIDVEFRFRRGNTRFVSIDPTDLLFIDTLHTAEQLHAELATSAARVRQRIVLHDTVTYGAAGEDGGPGLLPVIDSFLATEPWAIECDYSNNNGLTVLRRQVSEEHQAPQDRQAPTQRSDH